MKNMNSHSMTEKEISESLCTENKEIIKEIYSLSLKSYYDEGDRSKHLDSKASALFGFVGASLSAIFATLGILANPKHKLFSTILSEGYLYCIIAVVITMGLALATLFYTVMVTNNWRAPGEEDLFKSIPKYDGHIANDSTNSEKSAHDYKRFLTEHFWKLYKTCFSVNERKAKSLFWAQILIFTGLMFLIGIIIFIVIDFSTMSTENTTDTQAKIETPAVKPENNSGRPQPLPISSQGTSATRELNQRPTPLMASSEGRNVHLSEGRPEPIKPSSKGILINNSNDK